jgi:hypothetical protein
MFLLFRLLGNTVMMPNNVYNTVATVGASSQERENYISASHLGLMQ